MKKTIKETTRLLLQGNLTKDEADKILLDLYDVVSSAWYCEISTINGQWFEIVTGKNETDVCIKIEKKFGKVTKYQLIDKYEIM